MQEAALVIAPDMDPLLNSGAQLSSKYEESLDLQNVSRYFFPFLFGLSSSADEFKNIFVWELRCEFAKPDINCLHQSETFLVRLYKAFWELVEQKQIDKIASDGC